MPRKPRDRSPSNCYHIITRGINKQDIFFDNNDKGKLLKEISRTKEKYEYELYAYVLMPNHIHLLIKENTHSISEIMRSLLISYAEYINKKYDRIGYVLQNRCTSKPVENDIYFRNVLRYIHLNPQKAGISIYNQYNWSSYQDYCKGDNSLVNVEKGKNRFDNINENFEEFFKKFHNKQQNDSTDEEIMEYEIKSVLEDEDLYRILKEKIGEQEIHNLHRFQKEYRDKVLMKIFEIKGTNCAQISRVTGVNKKLIKKARQQFLKNKLENQNSII